MNVGLTAAPSIGEPPASSAAASRRIFGSGEMADRVRGFDWAATSLGAIEGWPEPLVTSVNILLGSRHPLFLWWGPDLIQVYNDAYRPSFGEGKHPRALGQTARECWSEIWEYLESRIDVVMREGQATWYEDQYVPILRNGRLEEVYWTWSDSPVRDAEGRILGIFVACSETTNRVLAERELSRSRERLQLTLQAADLGTWSYDPREETFTGDANMQRIFGAPAASGDHAFWQEILHPDDRRAAREAFESALAGAR
jgi:PAS domain-containing protein